MTPALAFTVCLVGPPLLFFLGALLLASLRPSLAALQVATAPQTVQASGLPHVPRSLFELQRMDPTDFEYLSAAILIALFPGLRFHRHTGQSGDAGVDVLLINQYGQFVGVQSKRYEAGNTVGGPKLREFWGSLLFYQTAYGYILTTSSFTADAMQIISASHGRIQGYDGVQLMGFLHDRTQAIQMALRDIYAASANE